MSALYIKMVAGCFSKTHFVYDGINGLHGFAFLQSIMVDIFIMKRIWTPVKNLKIGIDGYNKEKDEENNINRINYVNGLIC